MRVAQSTVTCLLLSQFLTAAPCPQTENQEEQIARHYEKAREATQKGRYQEAESEYQAVLKLAPSLAEAYANLGMVYYVQSKYPLAAEAYQKALKIRPNLNRARLYLGSAEFYLGKYEEAVQTLESALAGELEEPYRKLGRVNLARSHLALDRIEKAIEILNSLSRDYPQDADVYYMLGKAYLRLSAAAGRKLGIAGNHPRARQMLAENFANQRKFKEAIDEYLIALSLNSSLPGARYSLALLLLHDGRWNEGREQLEIFLKENPGHEEARQLLEKCQTNTLSNEYVIEAMGRGQSESTRLAAGFFDPVPTLVGLESSEAGNSPLHEAQKLYVRGEYEDAASLLKGAATTNPKDYDVLYWLVKSYQALAVRAFGHITQVAPDSARAHQFMAEGLDKQDRWEEAVKEYSLALERNPRLPGIHYAMAQTLVKLTRYEEAKEEFERELEIDPYNAGASYYLGQMAYRDGQYDEALRYCQRAIEIYPDFGNAHEQLGQILARMDQNRQAIAHLRIAARLLPDNHSIHYQLSRIHRALGQSELARMELEIFRKMEKEKKEATLSKAESSLKENRRSQGENPDPSEKDRASEEVHPESLNEPAQADRK